MPSGYQGIQRDTSYCAVRKYIQIAKSIQECAFELENAILNHFPLLLELELKANAGITEIGPEDVGLLHQKLEHRDTLVVFLEFDLHHQFGKILEYRGKDLLLTIQGLLASEGLETVGETLKDFAHFLKLGAGDLLHLTPGDSLKKHGND